MLYNDPALPDEARAPAKAMMSKRALFFGIAGIVILALVYWFATPFAWLLFKAGDEIFPSRISWDAKNAWMRCESAIAGQTAWPETSQARCAAMQLCANEAVLSEQQVDALYQAIRETPGCQAP